MDLRHNRNESTLRDIAEFKREGRMSFSLKWGQPDAKVIAALREWDELEELIIGGPYIIDWKFVLDFQQLKSLRITGANIDDLSALDRLERLERLNLSECSHLRSLSPLVRHGRLVSLTLQACHALVDISALSQLENLGKLHLYGSKLLSDIGVLQHLRMLENLAITRSSRLRDIEVIGELPALTNLNLTDCLQVKHLPNNGLRRLHGLSLVACSSLKDLEGIQRAENLAGIELRECGALESIVPLSANRRLRSLDISGCVRLKSILPIYGLEELSSIRMSRCKALEDIQPLTSLKGLKQLRARRIGSDHALEFPLSISRTCTEIRLFGSRFANLPDELSGASPEENVAPLLARFLQELSKGSPELREAKLMLVGNGRSGKSSLVRALRNEPHQPKEQSTHGIRHWRWSPSLVLQGDEEGFPRPVDVNIWDFGGQQIYHELHRLFMGTRAVFVLLWNPWENEWKLDPANPDDPAVFQDDEYHPLEYWLDQIHAYSRRTPQIILVRNFMDKDKAYAKDHKRRAPNSWKDVVSDRYRDAENIHYVEFSAIERDKPRGQKRMAELRLAIDHALNEQMRQLMSRYIPKGRYELRQKLADLVKEGSNGEGDPKNVRTLSDREFDALVAEHCTVNGTHDTPKVLRFLNDIGALYYNERMPEKVVLDQSWLVDAIYTMLKEPRTREQLLTQEGLFTMTDLVSWGWGKFAEEERALFLDFMLSCGVAIQFVRAERSATKEPVYLAPAFLPKGSTRSMQRLLATQPTTGRREQAWTEHQWLGRDVALHAVAKAAEAFGNMGDYWRHGFLLHGKHGVQVSMKWEPSSTSAGGSAPSQGSGSPTDAGSFGGRITLYATGKVGSGKTTLMREVVWVIEKCLSFPKDAEWHWEDLIDDPSSSSGPVTPVRPRPSVTEDARGPNDTREVLPGFSSAHTPSSDQHSPVWIGFSYKGSTKDGASVGKGQRVRDALYKALKPKAQRAGVRVIDYQDPQSHGLPNTEALMKALSLYSTYSLAIMDEEYWASPDCMAELAMLYSARPENEFSPEHQQLFHVAKMRSFMEPAGPEYRSKTNELAREARSILKDFKPSRSEDMGDAFEAMAKDRRLYWYLIARKPSRLHTFNKAIREFQNEHDNPPVDDPSALEHWAQEWAVKALGHVARA